MLFARNYRETAWGKLKGLWEIVVLTTLLYIFITSALSAIDSCIVGGLRVICFFGSIANFIVGGALAYGYNKFILELVRGNGKVKIEGLFDGFKQFGRAFGVYVINGVLIFLWALLLIIPGIIKALSYGMSYYILIDNPEMSAIDARKKSMEMMQGNKWRLFCLHFSFIGWWLLCILTLGILTFWVKPYEQAAEAEFYQSLLPPEA